jgi:tetratricopeptide (TPR) repeat protein
MEEENASRLLANAIAHQWWGNAISPTTRNDAWITNGMCRYAEMQFVEKSSSHDGFQNALLNVSASALAYDGFPLSRVAQYPEFSPEFETLTYDKGAMIFRMLHWQIGDVAFQQTLHAILSRQAGTISAAELERIAESASHQNLRPFFTQWLDSTGAPALTDNWTLYRLGYNKGFRTIGEITEDLDLFRMSVDIRDETAGKPIDQRIDVSGPQSQFVLETPQMLRSISMDPEHWLLLNNPEMQVRVHILRGQNAAARNDDTEAIREYREALKINNVSSLASYRLGEVYFALKNYQAGANAFRDALHGDGLPKWTEVWSDVQLGKIFDATGQRERAVNQYREAAQTADDTGSAVDLARGYIARAYQPPAQ